MPAEQIQEVAQQIQTALQNGLNPAQLQQIGQQFTTALTNAGIPLDPATAQAALEAFVAQVQNGLDASQLQAVAQQVATALANAGRRWTRPPFRPCSLSSPAASPPRLPSCRPRPRTSRPPCRTAWTRRSSPPLFSSCRSRPRR